MVSQLRSCQGLNSGREEHGLIVRVGDQQGDALALQCGQRAAHVHRVHPERGDEDGSGSPCEPRHLERLLLVQTG